MASAYGSGLYGGGYYASEIIPVSATVSASSALSSNAIRELYVAGAVASASVISVASIAERHVSGQASVASFISGDAVGVFSGSAGIISTSAVTPAVAIFSPISATITATSNASAEARYYWMDEIKDNESWADVGDSGGIWTEVDPDNENWNEVA